MAVMEGDVNCISHIICDEAHYLHWSECLDYQTIYNFASDSMFLLMVIPLIQVFSNLSPLIQLFNPSEGYGTMDNEQRSFQLQY